jgi:hypothetical protein
MDIGGTDTSRIRQDLDSEGGWAYHLFVSEKLDPITAGPSSWDLVREWCHAMHCLFNLDAAFE